MMARACIAGSLLVMTACGREMAAQPRYDAFGSGPLFRDGKVLQTAPAGTFALEDPAWKRAVRERPAMSPDLLKRGRQRFDIYCSPCHGLAGDGLGTVPGRGFPRPPSFHSERLEATTAARIFAVITNGYGVMYSYGSRVAPRDRWAIAAYIRALQLSQRARLSQLDEVDATSIRNRLESEEGASDDP